MIEHTNLICAPGPLVACLKRETQPEASMKMYLFTLKGYCPFSRVGSNK